MNRSKKYMMAAALATLSCGAMAQGLNTGYFIDGYAFRHNLNPAYGNDQNYVSIPALGNIQVRTQGNFGLGDVLFDNPRYGIDSDKKKTTFMNPYIADGEALKGFASGNNRINADVDITLLSAGFKAWGGYNTISLDARTNVGLSLPYELFAFAKNTGNQSYDIGDIHAHAQSFVQLAPDRRPPACRCQDEVAFRCGPCRCRDQRPSCRPQRSGQMDHDGTSDGQCVDEGLYL